MTQLIVAADLHDFDAVTDLINALEVAQCNFPKPDLPQEEFVFPSIIQPYERYDTIFPKAGNGGAAVETPISDAIDDFVLKVTPEELAEEDITYATPEQLDEFMAKMEKLTVQNQPDIRPEDEAEHGLVDITLFSKTSLRHAANLRSEADKIAAFPSPADHDLEEPQLSDGLGSPAHTPADPTTEVPTTLAPKDPWPSAVGPRRHAFLQPETD